MAYVISDNDCIACGSCYNACPLDAITEGKSSYKIDEELCVECGSCANECPVGAITQE